MTNKSWKRVKVKILIKFCWAPVLTVLRHASFVSTYNARSVPLRLKSLWNLLHSLEQWPRFPAAGWDEASEVFLGIWHRIRTRVMLSLAATPWQWLCVTADLMWFLPSPGSGVDHGDFWALLCSPATAVTKMGEEKKMLERDDRWRFSHDSELPQSAPC